jgi:CarD family transcriptional regulator
MLSLATASQDILERYVEDRRHGPRRWGWRRRLPHWPIPYDRSGGRAVQFEVGSRVVYPSHGVAEIVGREKREIDGEKVTCLVLSVRERGWGTTGAMRVSIPEDRAEELGVRSAISEEDADEVLDVLAVENVRVPSNWSRRFKNHQEKLKSGDIYECAEVVRNLAVRSKTARLSSAENSMYAKARYILISELSVSWDTTEDEAEARVDQALRLEPAS